jgi:hypothetical protein
MSAPVNYAAPRDEVVGLEDTSRKPYSLLPERIPTLHRRVQWTGGLFRHGLATIRGLSKAAQHLPAVGDAYRTIPARARTSSVRGAE